MKKLIYIVFLIVSVLLASCAETAYFEVYEPIPVMYHYNYHPRIIYVSQSAKYRRQPVMPPPRKTNGNTHRTPRKSGRH